MADKTASTPKKPTTLEEPVVPPQPEPPVPPVNPDPAPAPEGTNTEEFQAPAGEGPTRHLQLDNGQTVDVSTSEKTNAEVGPPPDSYEAPTPSGDTGWYYCLNQGHGGASLGSDARLFVGVLDGCPVCPVCVDENGNNLQVNAIPTEEGVVPDLRPRVASGYAR